MPSLNQVTARLQELVSKQLALVNDETRPWSDRKGQFDRLEAELKSAFEQHAAVKGITDLDRQLHGSSSADAAVGRTIKSLEGLQIIGPSQLELTDAEIEGLGEAYRHGKSFGAGGVRTKDFITSAPYTDTPTRVMPPVAFRREPTRVLSLIPVTGTSSPVIRYYQTTSTNNAAPVGEGDLKPQSGLTLTPVDAAATKIAHWDELSTEANDDVPGFLSFVESDLVAGLVAAENAEVLSSAGTGDSKWPGLLSTTGIITRAVGADTGLDALEKAMTDLRVGPSFTEPDGIVMHPTNWSALRRFKDSQNRYMIGNPGEGVTGQYLWDVPVVLTTGIAVGTAIVGAFQESTLAYIREPIGVRVDRGGDAFTSNLVRVLAEERLILTVPRPKGLVKVTGLAS